MADMPRILDCSVTDCSYNKEKSCGAAAITVGYSTSCTTFIPLTVTGGLERATPFVGACQKAECVHTPALEQPAVADGRMRVIACGNVKRLGFQTAAAAALGTVMAARRAARYLDLCQAVR